jgi:quercetin dioxygenase-like cupin family protein
MPGNIVGLGHKHKTEHFNIILEGHALVMIGEEVVQEVRAGDIFVSKPGDQKILHMLEKTVWITIHANPTDEKDTNILDDMMIEKSEVFLAHEKRLKEGNVCLTG